MPPTRIGTFTQAWYRWKALRLPWRKRFLAGYDLQGNTFWEFRLTRGESNERWRRIVNYPRSTHYSQVKVSPLWHQWLRHTRQDAPTLEEQQGEVLRQERIKYLAAEADARWEAKARLTDAPGGETGQRLPPLRTGDAEQEGGGETATSAKAKVPETMKEAESKPDEKPEDPWAKAKAQGPSETWQPSAWDPTAAKKR